MLLDNVQLVAKGVFLEARAARIARGRPLSGAQRRAESRRSARAGRRVSEGRGRAAAMVEHFGLPVVQAYMQHVQDNAEEAVRRVIDALTDGDFEYAMDNGARVRVSIRIDKQARAARIDFTGTSAQQPNNFNAPVSVTRAAVLYVFRTLVNDEIPMNAGCLKPLRDHRAGRLDAQSAVSGGGRRRQRRDLAGRDRLPVRRARRARGEPGHDEQLHVRRRRASVLRDHLPAARAPDRISTARRRCRRT